MSSRRQIVKGAQPPLQPNRSRVAFFNCGFHNPTSRLRPCRNNMLCDGGFMSSVHLPTMSTQKRHTAASAGSISLLLATVLGRFTSGPLAPLPCDRVPSRARAREVPIRSARLISAVHSSGHPLATLGRLAQTHTHEEHRQRDSGFVDIPRSPGSGHR